MKFRILLIDTKNIYYSFSFYEEIFEPYESYTERRLFIKNKPIEYLFTVLQVTKDLPSELREFFFIKSLILEFKEEQFLELFDENFSKELRLKIHLDEIENNSSNSELDYYNSDLEFGSYLTD